MRAIVLHSGGQDSSTCLLFALASLKYDEIICLAFDYGQRHSNELHIAQLGIRHLQQAFPETKLVQKTVDVKGILQNSALLDGTDINQPHELDDSLPASFVPGRNLLFLTIAGSLARSKGIFDIYTGVCQTDYSGYPDCRDQTINDMQKALNSGLFTKPVGAMKIITPLMYLTKARTWAMAKNIGERVGIDGVAFIRDFTMTDYNGNLTKNEWGFGRRDNAATELRAKGYFEAKEKGLI